MSEVRILSPRLRSTEKHEGFETAGSRRFLLFGLITPTITLKLTQPCRCLGQRAGAMRAWSHGRTRILLLLVRHMVLIVDDDEDVREAVRDLVGMKGYRVEEARDGEQALALLERTEVPCIILLDLVMPVMDGWQF